LVSCNYSADLGITGATGATNQNSSDGQSPNQNAMIPVKKGDVYFLHIGQFTASTIGTYTLDFGTSTARIGEDIAPSIGNPTDFVEVITPYIIRLTFSEAVECASVEAINLQITGHSLINHTICNSAGFSTEFIYSISPPLEVGNHVLKVDGLLKDGCENSQVLNENIGFEVDVNVDINPTLQSQINIYPNPTTETIFVELPKVSSENVLIEIYNIEGKLLQILPILNQKTAAIEVSNYPKGIYYLKVNVGNRHWTEKVVVC